MENPKFGMNGNGCAGSIARGVSTGKIWLSEMFFQPRKVVLARDRTGSASTMADLDQFLAQVAPAALLLGGKVADALAHLDQLFDRRQPVVGGGR